MLLHSSVAGYAWFSTDEYELGLVCKRVKHTTASYRALKDAGYAVRLDRAMGEDGWMDAVVLEELEWAGDELPRQSWF